MHTNKSNSDDDDDGEKNERAHTFDAKKSSQTEGYLSYARVQRAFERATNGD